MWLRILFIAQFLCMLPNIYESSLLPLYSRGEKENCCCCSCRDSVPVLSRLTLKQKVTVPVRSPLNGWAAAASLSRLCDSLHSSLARAISALSPNTQLQLFSLLDRLITNLSSVFLFIRLIPNLFSVFLFIRLIPNLFSVFLFIRLISNLFSVFLFNRLIPSYFIFSFSLYYVNY